MKKIAIGAIAALMLTTAAQAADKKIGATVSSLEFTFIAVMAKGMTDHTGKLPGVKLQLEDAKNDKDKLTKASATARQRAPTAHIRGVIPRFSDGDMAKSSTNLITLLSFKS